MSSLRKITRTESDAYQAYVKASSDAVIRTLDGLEDDETARLRRRAGAYRAQWLAAARRLEDATLKRGGAL